MDDLEKKVKQFERHELPGQPSAVHMGTFYLVNDLWAEIKKLRAQQGQSSRPDKPCEVHQLVKTNDGNFLCQICGKIISGG